MILRYDIATDMYRKFSLREHARGMRASLLRALVEKLISLPFVRSYYISKHKQREAMLAGLQARYWEGWNDCSLTVHKVFDVMEKPR